MESFLSDVKQGEAISWGEVLSDVINQIHQFDWWFLNKEIFAISNFRLGLSPKAAHRMLFERQLDQLRASERHD